MVGLTPSGANLQYSIISQQITGIVDGTTINIHAVSGGRGGSTTKGAVDTNVMNNIFAMGQKTDHKKGIHGGPLPMGTYRINMPAHNPHLGYSAKLIPVNGTFLFGTFGRDGFYIHGRGPHGSDGCIVPDHPGDLVALLKAITHAKGGVLTVTF